MTVCVFDLDRQISLSVFLSNYFFCRDRTLYYRSPSLLSPTQKVEPNREILLLERFSSLLLNLIVKDPLPNHAHRLRCSRTPGETAFSLLPLIFCGCVSSPISCRLSLPSLYKTSRLKVVGLGRFELPTPRLSSVCSDQLSYRPVKLARRKDLG